MAATLADQWTAHADSLPVTTPEGEMRRAKREWYAQQLDRLAAAPKTAENAALLQEALAFGRAIGTRLEHA